MNLPSGSKNSKIVSTTKLTLMP